MCYQIILLEVYYVFKVVKTSKPVKVVGLFVSLGGFLS